MEIKQKKDGSATISFTEGEIALINKKKEFEISDMALRHFGNQLMGMVVLWNKNFNEKVKKEPTIPKAKTEK
jgi:hypothetical protein